MVFQSFNLFPHMTAAENVMLGLVKVKRLAKAEARSIAEHWLGRVGLAERSDHYPYQRSEEHTSELQSLMRISYAVFCLKKKTKEHNTQDLTHIQNYHTDITYHVPTTLNTILLLQL